LRGFQGRDQAVTTKLAHEGRFFWEVKMNDTMCCAEIQPLAAGEITELVRGNENALLERFMPIVRRQCVTLDLESVTRIDAAGLAALITVYCTARESGHDFTILNPSSHVAEILAVVGLDKILVAQNARGFSESCIPAEATAA
jgi:anti-anti-sigma factor